MAAVFYAALSGALFGALAVAVRHALRRGADPYVGAAVVPSVAVVVAVLISVPSLAVDEIHPGDLWPFAVAGLSFRARRSSSSSSPCATRVPRAPRS